MREIPFARPWIDENDRQAVLNVLQGYVLTHGPQCKSFEKEFASFAGPSAHAVSVSSCMAALHMAYFHYGIGPGDEVIAPAMTHVATIHAIELSGAKPVFIDADPETGNIAVDLVADKITSKTKAITLVHFVGIPCEMDPILDLAAENGLRVIEDCAIAIGARYKGSHVGLLGDVGCFSFYPVKHITTGEGGMLLSRDESRLMHMARQRAFGVDRSYNERKIPGFYDVVELGMNYRMSEIQAALGRTQVAKLPEILRRRRENFQQLKQQLGDLRNLRILDVKSADQENSCYCLEIVLQGPWASRRNEVIEKLNAQGIGTSIYYPQPVPRMSCYRQKYGYQTSSYPRAEELSDCGLALPVGPHLGLEDMDYIAETLRNVMASA